MNQPLPPGARYADEPLPPGARYADDPAPSKSGGNYRELARRHALENGVDPDLFVRQIEAESSFNPHARSPVGAMGLGQLMPDTAKELGVTDPWDPDQNLSGAARYMAQKLKHYGGNYAKTLAAYNGGDGAVQYAQKHGTLRGYAKDETYNYVRKIMGGDVTSNDAPLPPGARYADEPAPHHAQPQHPAQHPAAPPPPPANPLGDFISMLQKPLAGTASAAETQPSLPPGAHYAPMPDPRGGMANAPGLGGTTPHGNIDPNNPAVKGVQRVGGTGMVVDYLSAAGAPPISAVRDLNYQREQRAKLAGRALEDFNRKVVSHDPIAWPNQAALGQQVKQHGLGPESVHAIVEHNASLTGPGPGAVGEHASPLAKTGLEVAAQVLNPTNYVGPGAAKIVAGLARGVKAKALIPVSDAAESMLARTSQGQQILDAAGRTRETFAPFAGVRRAARRVGSDPDVAEQAVRTFVSAPNTAKANAEKVVRAVFQGPGIGPKERIEIERLSELDAQGNHLNPPRLPDPNGDLLRRSRDLRAAYIDTTTQQRALDLLDDKHTFDPNSYSYRGGDVYQKAPLPPSVQAFFQDVRAAFTPGGGRITAGTTKKSKLYTHFDEAEPHLDLAKYDPADQLLAYMTHRATNVGRERAIRQLRDLGVLQDLAVIDPKTGVSFGTGKTGVEAAGRVGTSRAEHGAFTDALAELNAERTARGETALNPAQYAQMRKAVQAQGTLGVKSEMSERTARTLDRLATRTDRAAEQTGERAGSALLQGLQRRIADHDALAQKIAKAHETAARGSGQSDAASLVAMVAQRDRMALEIDALQERVQGAAVRPFGKTPGEAYYDTAERHGVSSPQAGAAFEHAQEAPQIVARLQGAYEAAQSLPPSAQRAQIVRALRTLSAKGAALPEQVGDAVQAERLLGRVQAAMGVVSAAGKDESSLRVIAQMEQAAQALERRIGRDGGRLYGARDAVAKPVERLADYVTAGSAKARKEAQDRLDAYEFAKASHDDVKFFESAFNDALSGRATRTTKSILDFSQQKAAERVGMGPLADPLGSPTLKYSVAPKPLIRFFQNQGAPPHEASAIGSWIDGMNRLARVGILYNPVMHAGWNLGTHFLAAGGPMEFFGGRIWQDPAKWSTAHSRALGRPVSGLEWQHLAEENNAVVHMANTHPMFGGSYAKTYLDGPRPAESLRDVGHNVNAVLSQAQATNGRIVFNAFETRYSVALFQHFVEREGMSPAAAGIAVRKALGDYTNISRSGIEGALHKALMFYPWMKTAVPFWAKTLLVRPQFVSVPGLGLRRWNEAMGDPDIGKESDWTIDRGVGPDGGRQKTSWPGPQKWVGDLLNVLVPARGDVDVVGSRMDTVKKIANTHLRPFGAAGALVPLAETVLEPAKAPGGASFETVFDKREDASHIAGQTAAYFGRKLPFEQDIAGLASTAQTLGHGSAAPLGGLLGGFQYDRLPRAKQMQLTAAERLFDRAIKDASRMTNPTARARRLETAREAHRRAVERITGHAAAAPPPGAR